MVSKEAQARRGRQIALLIAAVGVLYVAITALGASLGWSHRTMALFDLAALAGFAMAIWMIYGLWRARQNNKD